MRAACFSSVIRYALATGLLPVPWSRPSLFVVCSAAHTASRISRFKPANLFFPNSRRKRIKIKQIGRFQSVIWSNLCTRHIPIKLTLRGHDDWPDKQPSRLGGAPPLGRINSPPNAVGPAP